MRARFMTEIQGPVFSACTSEMEGFVLGFFLEETGFQGQVSHRFFCSEQSLMI